METLQRHIFYSGTVQGIGFRYTVQRYASELKLTGWVRNLKDGRVEILVEGAGKEIEELIGRIDRRYDGYIRGKELDEALKPDKQFTEFTITESL